MEIILMITGILLIGTGRLMYKYPMLIAGYNTIPKKEREKINIEPVARKARLVFMVMGTILIVIALLSKLLGMSGQTVIGILPVIVIFGGVIFLLVWINRDPEMAKINKTSFQSKSGIIGLCIAIVITVVAFGSIFKVAQPAEIEVADGKVIISGSYGVEIPLSEITKVEVVDHIPRVIIRTNGLGMGRYSKGHFRLEEYGRSLLFLHSGKAPYMVLATEKHGMVVINRDTPEEIYELQRKLDVLGLPLKSK